MEQTHHTEQILSKREQNKADCRLAILKASRRLFSSRGYENTRMEEIAQRAGVSKATLYNYFPNKESLLIGTIDDVLERVTYGAEAAAAAGKTDLEQLFAVFEILVQCALKYPALTRRIAYLNALEDSTLYHCFRPCFEVVYSRIDLAHAQGTFRRDVDRFTILETMLGIFYVVLYHWDYIYPDQEQKIHDRLQVVFYTHLGPYLTPQAK